MPVELILKLAYSKPGKREKMQGTIQKQKLGYT